MTATHPIELGDSEISLDEVDSAASSPNEDQGSSDSNDSEAGSAKGDSKRVRRETAPSKPRAGEQPNNVRKLRQEAMMSKAELARRAHVSPLTVDRVEAGCPCRMDTKRKILEALGLSPSARTKVWPDIDD